MPAYRNSSTDGLVASPITVTKPTLKVGDRVVVGIGRLNGVLPTPPTGFTQVGTEQVVGTVAWSFWTKTYGPSEGAWTFTSAGATMQAQCHGCFSANPPQITSVSVTTSASGTSHGAGPVTAVLENSLTLLMYGSLVGATTYTSPGSFNERQDANNACIDDAQQILPGSSGTKTATSSATTQCACLALAIEDLGPGKDSGQSVHPGARPGIFLRVPSPMGFAGGLLGQPRGPDVGYPAQNRGPGQHIGLFGAIGTRRAESFATRVFNPTTYLLSLDGGITPSGTLSKTTQRSLGGGITPAGTLFKTTLRSLVGAFTPSGTVTKQVNLTKDGAIAPSGTVRDQVNKGLSGGIAPSGGITKQTNKQLAGGVTPSGTLATLHIIFKSLAGAITPTATLSGIKTIASIIYQKMRRRSWRPGNWDRS